MSHDERAYLEYVADCKRKGLPAADISVWQMITKPLGWQVIP
jgi:hypothetical protein